MSLIRWEPFGGMDDVFARMIPATFGRWPRLAFEGNGNGQLDWAPSADISETDGEYLIRADLPAVRKEDVKVTFDDGTLTIQGERKQQKEAAMEHRWGRRVPIAIDVSLICRPYEIGSGHLRNVSISGAYVETNLTPRVLTRVRIRGGVKLWGHTRTFEVPACVVRRDGDGIGIEWSELAPSGINELLDLGAGRGTIRMSHGVELRNSPTSWRIFS